MATEQQQATLRQLIKDVARYGAEIYPECDWDLHEVGVFEDWYYVDFLYDSHANG